MTCTTSLCPMPDLRAQRKLDREPRAAIKPDALPIDRPSLRPDQLARQRQPEPHAARLCRDERLEQVFGHNLGDAWPVVLDLDSYPLVYRCHANGDATGRPTRFRRGVDGVVDHIDQGLLEL